MEQITNKLDHLLERYRAEYSRFIRLEEPVILGKLEFIKSMAEEYERHGNEIFFDEILKSLVEVVERQMEMLTELKVELAEREAPVVVQRPPMPVDLNLRGNLLHGYVACQPREFQTDKQLQEAFTAYLTGGDRPLSIYTINDYCSRLRMLWGVFWDLYRDREHAQWPQELWVNEQKISPDHPLLNVFHNLEVLRNALECLDLEPWIKQIANTKAALKKMQLFIDQCF